MTREENFKFRKSIIREQFINCAGYEPNFDDPRTFNEKLQWLKLNYHEPLMTKCVDKYSVREHIKVRIGEEYLVPLLGVWDDARDIDFDSLPNQFVLKVNWGSSKNIIVKDKSKLNIEDVKSKLNEWILPFANHYYYSFEWPYKYIPPKIIAEKFMKNKDFENLTVYKFFCFSGVPYMSQVILDDKTEDERINYYDLNWNKLELKQNFENFDYNLERPNNYDKMIDIAKKLASDFKHFIRIDLFEVDEKIYFSEYTFYSDNGINKFTPDYWDLKLGSLINLPSEKKIEYDFVDRDTLLNQSLNLEYMGKEYRNMQERLDDYKKELSFCKEKYKILKDNSFALFGFFNEREYFTLIIFGIKIVFKKNKEQSRAEQSRAEQSRAEQSRAELICKGYIHLNNTLIINKIQPMLQYKVAA